MSLESKTRDFHESFHEFSRNSCAHRHSCSVVPERDVMEMDIHGTSFSTRLKRWWCGLFLLSYSDQRSRLFYTSSYSMRMDRQRHFRKCRGRIHPLSKFRMLWDFFMMLVFALNKITFHHNTSFIFSDLYRSFYYFGAGLELIIISDLFLHLATGYINHQDRKIVLDKRLGVLHYCSTKLFLHVASAMPLQWMIFLRYGSNFDCSLCKTSRFICVLEIFSVLNLFRLYECSKYCSRERSSYKMAYFLKFLRLFVLGLLTMLQFLEMADIVTLRVMAEQGHIEENSYVAVLLRNRYGVEVTSDPLLFFIYDFSRVCKSVLLFSFAYRKLTYYLDRIISVIGLAIAYVFYLWTITECFALICLLKFPEGHLIMLKNSMVNMVRCRQLSDKVTAKLNKYYDFNFSKLKAVERGNQMFKTMPRVLKEEQFMFCYSQFIMRIPYFAEWPMTIKNAMVPMLKEEIFLENDLLAESEGLCIVVSGVLALYSEEKETGHLIDGDYFGELSLVTDGEVRNTNVIALTPCMILILSKTSFRRFMRLYPDLFYKMKRQLEERFRGSKTSLQLNRTN